MQSKVILCPLIGHHVIWFVIIPSDQLSSPLIGYHASSYLPSIMSNTYVHHVQQAHHVHYVHHVNHVLMLHAEIPSIWKKCHWQTDMGNPTNAIASHYAKVLPLVPPINHWQWQRSIDSCERELKETWDKTETKNELGAQDHQSDWLRF